MQTSSAQPSSISYAIDEPIVPDLQTNLRYIRETIGNSADLVVKELLALKKMACCPDLYVRSC